ncbi:MAG: phosphatase PAP2 family protein [Acidimicrobiales bacterium]
MPDGTRTGDDPSAAGQPPDRPPVGAATSGRSRSAARARLAGARPWGRHATEAAMGIGLLALSWLLLADRTDRVPGWEADVFAAVNGLPGVLEWPLWPVMQLGTVPMYLVGGLFVYWLTRRTRPALATASAVLLGWVMARVVKEAIQRGRPGALLDDVNLRTSGFFSGHGYVSGHTTVAFAWATVLTAVLPGRWRFVPFPLAALVGFSRIFFGAHLPLDVLGGAGLGILCGLTASLAFGTIHPGRPTPVR